MKQGHIFLSLSRPSELSTVFKSTATEAYTGKLSSSYKNQQKCPPAANQSICGTQKRSNQWEVCSYGELKLVSKRSVDRVALLWSMAVEYWSIEYMSFMGFIHLCHIGAICPLVHPTALEKPNSTCGPNENVKSNKTDRKQDLREGFVSKLKTLYRCEINHKIKHFYNTQFTQLTPQFPVCRKFLDSNT